MSFDQPKCPHGTPLGTRCESCAVEHPDTPFRIVQPDLDELFADEDVADTEILEPRAPSGVPAREVVLGVRGEMPEDLERRIERLVEDVEAFLVDGSVIVAGDYQISRQREALEAAGQAAELAEEHRAMMDRLNAYLGTISEQELLLFGDPRGSADKNDVPREDAGVPAADSAESERPLLQRREFDWTAQFTWEVACRIVRRSLRNKKQIKIAYIWNNLDYSKDERAPREGKRDPLTRFPLEIPERFRLIAETKYGLTYDFFEAYSEARIRNQACKKLGIRPGGDNDGEGKVFWGREAHEDSAGRIYVTDDFGKQIPLTSDNGAPICKPIATEFTGQLLDKHSRAVFLWPKNELGCRIQEHLRIAGAERAQRVMESYFLEARPRVSGTAEERARISSFMMWSEPHIGLLPGTVQTLQDTPEIHHRSFTQDDDGTT